MSLGAAMTVSGMIGMAVGTTNSLETVAAAAGDIEAGYPGVSRVVDIAIDQLLVNAEDFNPLSRQGEVVLRAQL
jgi:hypothetical protein